jgi:glycosyltransferase involved in cell wall biosynthesis
MNEMGINRPTVWTSLPTAIDVLDLLDPSAVVYYCGDDFGALAGVDHRAVSRLEQMLVDRADVILVASSALQARFPVSKTHLIEHGVDAAPFAAAYPRPVDLPSGKPVMGFYGSLSNWLDLELLEGLAEQLPDWNLVLIGPCQCELGALLKRANVHWLGPRLHHQLPAYVQHWQVSLLPFLDNAQIRACNPLKLREYLASGKPVVSTEFPALAPYRQHVRVAVGVDAFVEAVRQAAMDMPSLDRDWLSALQTWDDVIELGRPSGQRQASIAEASWSARAMQVQRLLAGL